MSPFATRARESYMDWSSGKPDDITVVVAQVVIDNKSESNGNI